MTYEKVIVKVIMFNESDVITTSGGPCQVPGWGRGNNCRPNHSSDCHTQAWKDKN